MAQLGNGIAGAPSSSDRGAQWPALAGFLALCAGAAAIGGLFTAPGLREWYGTLHKPWWTPPSWIFGPVWSVLYVSMAVAAWLAWRGPREAGRRGPIQLFLLQLALNAAWPGIFFAFRMAGLAAAEIVALWAAIAATAIAFDRRSRSAALLMLPYLGWVSFAMALNIAIWRLNS